MNQISIFFEQFKSIHFLLHAKNQIVIFIGNLS